MRRAAKVDRNQKEIVKAWRQAGAVVLHTHQLKNAFDALVFFRGQTFCVEIKDGELPPSKRRLSEGEERCEKDLLSVGVAYWIINNVDEALQMIGV